jgi:membrane associated rhomboid family serine protease
MTPTPVGIRCPECSRQRTRVRQARAGSSYTQPTLTYMLIAINTIVQIASSASGSGSGLGSLGGSLVSNGALDKTDVAAGQYWRLITAGFLHAGFLHLLFNMIALYFLGSLLEPAIGRARFGLIYLVSLLCGSFGALLLSPSSPTVGASGAIFGLLGAAFIVARARGATALQGNLLIWIVLNLVFSFTASGISIGGHIGGLIGGALTAIMLLVLPERLHVPAYLGSALAVLVGVASVAGSIAIAGPA